MSFYTFLSLFGRTIFTPFLLFTFSVETQNFYNQALIAMLKELLPSLQGKKNVLLLLFSFILFTLQAQINGYPPISAKKNGIVNPLSPDPIINYTWANPKATDDLESYPLQPLSWVISNPASFDMEGFKKNDVIAINGLGIIRFDFGQTNAGWLEFESDDLTDSITMSISEYNEPAIVMNGAVNRIKTLPPIKHGRTYRLELNPELYEGVRFGWINVVSHRQTWHMKNFRLVCQTKPVNYRGSFSCSDPELTRIWYTGAYTVKLNLLHARAEASTISS